MNDAMTQLLLLRTRHGQESVELLFPGEPGYDEGRQVYNRIHDLHPLVIVRSLNQAVIRAVLKVVADNQLELAIRGGGHHIAGFGSTEGGVLLDFSPFNGVQLDMLLGIARVQPGARLRDVDTELCPQGYVVPTGTVSDTGIAGLTLGGGIGWFVGTLGFTCDNLVGADVMLASGEVVRAEDPLHHDLLWGLRGGGGNFGVVLEFRYRLSKLPKVYCGSITVASHDVSRVLPQLAAYMEQVCPANLVLAPVFTQSAESNQYLLSIDFCLSNYQSMDAIKALETALNLAGSHKFITDDFREWQGWFDERFQPPMRGYWKSVCLDEFNSRTMDTLLTAASCMPGERCSITVEHLNKSRRLAETSDSAFPLKSRGYGILFSARWAEAEDDITFVHWVKSAALELAGSEEVSSYSNYSLADSSSRTTFSGSDNERLISIKMRYDANNIFRRNHNIIIAK
ncbi:FAD-dependent oxidoreductase [Pseudomonas orientalis]|uniref:FAD/FMN-containing dehydrogenase n=1 Tax=Pseudomonas orientalis TaxID=76758 RepID=A0A1H2HCT4_9PSED|nr:FAD-dependent oxidoreductase [Pseudomonas orientalis]KRP61021.1 FAD-binding protein [Pseudomonas orientalis]SDU29645.1 FAD/FMN-containing dehydrogenase [Pseudomonas orientalis]